MNRFVLIKRAFSSVNKCDCTANRPAHLTTKLSTVREMRALSWNPDNKELLLKQQNEQWYKDACDFDRHMFKGLILFGIIATGSVTGYRQVQYNKTHRYKDDDDIRVNMAAGAFVGGVVGLLSAFFYPYSLARIVVLGGGAAYASGPAVLKFIDGIIESHRPPPPTKKTEY